MGYGITGWKFGGRQSITQNLNPGQFRGMGKPHYRSSVFVQNNYYGNMGMGMMYDNHCCGCNDGGGSNKFMNWMLGLGMFGNMLSGILGALGFGGDGSTETTNTTNTTNTTTTTNTTEPKEQDEFAGLKTLYPDGNFAKIGDKYYCILDGKRYEGDSVDDLMSKLPTGTAVKQEVEDPAVDPNKNKVDSDPAAEDPAGSNPADNPKADGGAGNSGAASRNSKDGATGANAGKDFHGWYQIGADNHTNNDSRLTNCKNAKELAGALIDSKTTGKLNAGSAGNKNLITQNQAAIAKALIQANPDKFNPDGSIKGGVDYNTIKIPDMQWIADTFANGTKSTTGNGRTVKRDANGVKQTYSHDGKQLKASYVNAKSYAVTTKNGQKYTVKVSPDGNEKWYITPEGKSISEKDFKNLTGLTGNDVLKKAKASGGETASPGAYPDSFTPHNSRSSII